MRGNHHLALRPYLEAIEKWCLPLAKEELLQLLLSLAGEAADDEREGFLAKIAALLPGADNKGEDKGDVEGLLDRINELQQEILERIAAIEEGTFWDDYAEHEGLSYYDDEGPGPLGEDQEDALRNCFDQAGRLFTRGQLPEAKIVYAHLFALLREIEDESSTWVDIEVDLREARARYCRLVYELAEVDNRVQELLAAMEVEAKGRLFDDEPVDYPQLRDLLDAQIGELKDFAAFLPVWAKALADKDVANDRLAWLRLEAAFMIDGMPAVVSLAREWGVGQPKGYLVWLKRLGEAGDWHALKEAAQEALGVLPAGKNRESAAEFLVVAGQHLHDDATILAGRRERFFSVPEAENLLSLLVEAGRQGVRERELTAATCLLMGQNKERAFVDHSLPVKALLMAGRLGEALALALGQQTKSGSWSYDRSAEVVFAATLHLIGKAQPDFLLIEELLQEYAGQRMIPFHNVDVNKEAQDSLYREITHGLGLATPSPDDLTRYLDWARKFGEERINSIVSSKHRSSYDRAAQILGALAEVQMATGNKAAAEHLLRDYYQVRYNRYAAFRKEVKKVVDRSPALRGVRL